MKISIVLFLIVTILTSCSNPNVIDKADMSEEIDLDVYDYFGTFLNGDELYIESYRYNMQDAAKSMIILRDSELYKLFDGMPSKPKFNKERTQILYIDYLQFEVIGNVTIYNSETGEETRYTDFAYGLSQDTVKDVEWFKDNMLLCVIGFSYGTVSQGGELYTLDIDDKELRKVDLSEVITEWTKRPYEIVDIYVDESGLEILLVEWQDDSYVDYFYTNHTLSYEMMGMSLN